MLYERIKELCKERGTTIAALERDLGFGRGYISKIDRHQPSLKKVAQIAEYLGVTVDRLKGIEPEEPAVGYYLDDRTAAAAQELFDNPGLRILFDAARDSRPEDLMLAAEMLRRMKGTNRDA